MSSDFTGFKTSDEEVVYGGSGYFAFTLNIPLKSYVKLQIIHRHVTVSKAEIKQYDSFFYPTLLYLSLLDLSIVWILSSPLGGVRYSNVLNNE